MIYTIALYIACKDSADALELLQDFTHTATGTVTAAWFIISSDEAIALYQAIGCGIYSAVVTALEIFWMFCVGTVALGRMMGHKYYAAQPVLPSAEVITEASQALPRSLWRWVRESYAAYVSYCLSNWNNCVAEFELAAFLEPVAG